MNDFLFAQVLTELEDAVGRENCSVREIDKLTHSVDYFWLSRMWADRGRRMPEADFVVSPKDAQETSKVVKIANYYKIPITAWGGGGECAVLPRGVLGGRLVGARRQLCTDQRRERRHLQLCGRTVREAEFGRRGGARGVPQRVQGSDEHRSVALPPLHRRAGGGRYIRHRLRLPLRKEQTACGGGL